MIDGSHCWWPFMLHFVRDIECLSGEGLTGFPTAEVRGRRFAAVQGKRPTATSWMGTARMRLGSHGATRNLVWLISDIQIREHLQ